MSGAAGTLGLPDLLAGDLVIDTDVASAMQKGNLADWASRQIVGRRVWLPFVTVGELWKWAEVRSWGERRRRDLESWMAIRRVIHADGEVAHTWGQLAAAASRRGRPCPQNDTWIAA
jgi:predicted nucleic acid-binding protein